MLALINTLLYALAIYRWIVIASVIFSWLYMFNVVNPRNQAVGAIAGMLYRLTEPVLRPIRRYMPDLGVDISPIVVIVLIFFLEQFLILTVAPAVL